MAGGSNRIWLYVRMGGLALVILFVLQLFVVNAFLEGQAMVLPGWPSNFWSLVAAFVMGLLLWPLAKAARLTWKDYEAAQRQAAEAAAKEEPGAPRGAEGGAASGEAKAAKPKGASSGGAGNAADIWTSAEEEPRSR